MSDMLSAADNARRAAREDGDASGGPAETERIIADVSEWCRTMRLRGYNFPTIGIDRLITSLRSALSEIARLTEALATATGELDELHRVIDTDGSVASEPEAERRTIYRDLAIDGAHALSALATARAEREEWAQQATENAKDVLRMSWLEAAGGKYDLTCWNVDWPNKNNGWTIGGDSPDDTADFDSVAKGDTARETLDEAIAKHPEILAYVAARSSEPRDPEGRAAK